MPAAEAADYRFNPFDLTKVWPHEDYPPIEIGRLVLNRNPDNFFAEVEQAAFSRHTSCPASARRRTRCSRAASSPTATPTATASASTTPPAGEPPARHRGAHQLRPRRLMLLRRPPQGREELRAEQLRRPAQTDRPLWQPARRSPAAPATTRRPSHAEDDDFVQAGNLYRLMSEDEKSRLIDNIAGFIAKVSRDDIAERAIDNFRQADGDFGKRLEAAVQALRG